MTAPEAPPPFMPAEVDLEGMLFMPIEVQKVMQSTLFVKSTGDEFKAAFALWCASWYETPAASLPNDDEMLAALSRAKNWPKVRAMAMKGWTLCADGRLYHEVVARNAIVAWDRRVEYREANENKTTRQARWRARLKELATQLRALGVTPPSGAGLEELEKLLVDAKASTGASTGDGRVDVSVDGGETGKTGTVRGTGTGTGDLLDSPLTGAVGGADPPDLPKPLRIPNCPYDEIVSAYHEILPELPGVKIGISDKRKRAFRAFWEWIFKSVRPDGSRRATDLAGGLEWMRGYFRRARDNDFVMGRTPRGRGHENWRCDIDFLLSEPGLRQVVEKTPDSVPA